MSSDIYVGLMSGTSLDGIDAVLVDFAAARPEIIASYFHPIIPSLRESLLALTLPGENEIEQMGQVDRELGRTFAEAVMALLVSTKTPAHRVRAIGSHGQTIRHRPDSSFPFTLQIGDPNTIAELTGITTIADFRRRDMAAGGQGAPLVPAFHATLLGQSMTEMETRVVLNIGGIANITLLTGRGEVAGYDTGPGNLLLDGWCQRELGEPYDQDGRWARSGALLPQLLEKLQEEPYFSKPAPKSSGRELFNLGWLTERLNGDEEGADVAATLVELTATTIGDAIKKEGCFDEIVVCGGGAANAYLMERLTSLLHECRVVASDAHGIPHEWVEATAFAWLARETLNRRSGSLPAVTGARGGRILGGIYQA